MAAGNSRLLGSGQNYQGADLATESDPISGEAERNILAWKVAKMDE